MPLGPREEHVLEQFMAWNLEIQAKLKAFQDALEEMGHPHAEAWAITRRLESQMLGPVMDYAENRIKAAEEIDRMIRERLDELTPGDEG